MTIGEKIIRLRNAAHLSQEQLAEKISVSRQSVSKWEMDQTVPQIDKLITLSDIFHISLDDMLKTDLSLSCSEVPAEEKKKGNRYFDTDGFRGEANKTLTADHAYRVGRFIGWYFASPLSGCRESGYRPRIVIGKDTRRSSYMLEYALASGIAASGGDACILHVTTTPSVSFITRQDEFDCGVMITASHNPFYDNGIKIVNRYGEKLDDTTTALIEAYLDGDYDRIGVGPEGIPFALREKIGSIVDYYAGRNRYIGYLISLAAHSYSQLRIGLDCANGAAWSIAKSVFEALGAKTYVIGAEPDGTNCNREVGSTHIEALQALVREKHLDCGYAFDGDADRCIAVDENGDIVDGDKIIYILAARLKEKGILDHNTAVYTVMSNSGLTRSLSRIGIKGVQTSVGDRFVYECMQKNGFRIGGEQSGHIILRKYATTGDGILTAIMLTEQMRDRKTTLSALAAPVQLFPQKLKNIRVSDKEAVLRDAEVLAKAAECEKKIGGNGRLLLRRSGTEPVVRVMAECETESLCDEYIDSVIAMIEKKGYRV